MHSSTNGVAQSAPPEGASGAFDTGTEVARGRSAGVKRAIDMLAGTALALVALPLVLVLAAISAVSFRAWPFFVQRRVGRFGHPFRLVKVRTLPRHVPRYADKYAIQGVPLPRWAQFARRHKLDELPQLFLVPLGKMSLVGPRPEMGGLHESFESAFATARTSMRPGCTGLWQISDQCHRLISEGVEYDKFYMRNHSVRLDLWILARTVRTVLGGKPVGLGDVPSWAIATPRVHAPSLELEPALHRLDA